MSAALKAGGIVVIGNLVSQVILFLSIPLISKLYDPALYGLYSIFLSLLIVFVSVGTLKYELAIPVAKSRYQAKALQKLSLHFAACFMFIIYIFLMIHDLVSDDGNPLFYLFPLSVYLTSWSLVQANTNLREGEFRLISCSKIVRSLFMVIVQVVGFKGGAPVLILGYSIGKLSEIFVLTAFGKRKLKGRSLRKSYLKKVACKYSEYPRYSTLSSFLNTVGVQLSPVLLALNFDMQIVGLYALSLQLLNAPVGLMSVAISQVYLSKVRELKKRNLFRLSSLQLSRTLFSASLLCFIPVYFSVDILTNLVFSGEWVQVNGISLILLPWIAMVFSLSPMTNIFISERKQKQSAIFQASMLISRSAAIYLGGLSGNYMLAISSYSITSAFVWFVFLFWMRKQLGVSYTQTTIEVLKLFVEAILIGLPILVAYLVIDPSPVVFSLILTVSFSIACYRVYVGYLGRTKVQ